MYPFTLCKCFFCQETERATANLISGNHPDIQIISPDIDWGNPEKFLSQFNGKDIHIFLFCLDKNPTAILNFINELQLHNQFAHHPMVLFSQDAQNLIAAFWLLKPFCAVPLPLTSKRILSFSNYVQHYYDIYEKENEQILELDFPSGSYRFQINDILFAEASNRKVLLHIQDSKVANNEQTIELPLSFHHFIKILPPNSLLQSHRSFLINPRNVLKVDKKQDHWTAKFYYSNEQAFISRSYKKQILDSIFTHIHKSNNIITKTQLPKD